MARRKTDYYKIQISKVRPGKSDEWSETYHVRPRKNAPPKIHIFKSEKKKRDQLLISIGGVPAITSR
jgi:hypothetical protein